jgi:phosphatidate phosphatase APP1
MVSVSALILAVAVVGAPLAAAVPQPTQTAPPPPFHAQRDVKSAASSVASSVASAVASALPSVLGDWPTLDEIKKKLDVSDNDLANVSTSALLIPSYANHTDQGWNVRFYGLVYKLPNVNASKLVDLINDFKTNNLNSTQQQLLQNRTQELASLPKSDANVTAVVRVNGTLVTNSTGLQLQQTDAVGEIDQFMIVPGLGDDVKTAKVIETGIVNATGPGNGTIILVPSTGISVVSDIDDVLRITRVYIPNQGLYNSFVQPYVNVPGMPELFNHWLKTLPGVAFHMDTTTPLQLTRTYVDYLWSNYPLGSLEMRPINVSEPSQILDARQQSLQRLFQTFPKRKFVLVGDTSSSTLLSAYPEIAQQHPDQIACIFIRNTSATDSDDKIPYDTSPFKNVNSSQYFFYRVPEDLYNLDISGGQCQNKSIPQNVTFGEQGGVLDHGKNGATVVPISMIWTISFALLGAISMVV